MRIVTRAELRKLPSGALYAAYHPGRGWPQGPTDMFLGDMEGCNDFVTTGIGSPESYESGELFEREAEMVSHGTAYPVGLAGGRDGLFEDEQRYLVWEDSDVAAIVVHTPWFAAAQGEWNGSARYRIVKADGTVRYQADEEDARSLARTGDTVERLYERHESEWRPAP